MAVGSLDEDRLSVDEHLLVLYLNLAEAYALWDALDEAVAVVEGDVEVVEVGCLGCPLVDIGDIARLEEDWSVVEDFGLIVEDFLAVGIYEAELECLALGCLELYFDFEASVGVVVVEFGGDEEVFDVGCGARVEVYLA